MSLMMFGHVLSHLDSISRNLIFQHHEKWPKRAGISKVPVNFRISSRDHQKEHQKLWGYMSSLFCFMDLGQRCRESKGCPEYWRNPPEAIWRPLPTWRREFRTIVVYNNIYCSNMNTTYSNVLVHII